MTLEEQLELSFYKELSTLNKKGNVTLVQHIETRELYVKKVYNHYDENIYKLLMSSNFNGIPHLTLIVKTNNTLITIEEYINGSTLFDLIENQDRKFTVEEVSNIISQICDIMHQFHSHNPPIIHRDIKASNVILDKSGKIFIIDFNITRQFNTNKNQDTQLMGTFGYAAPEQYGFTQCTPKTDIYAIGILCKYLITRDIDKKQTSISSLDRFIKKATEIDPNNRFSDVLSMKKALSHSIKWYIAISLYLVASLAISYTSATDFPVDGNFIGTFMCNILFLLSPFMYAYCLKKFKIKFHSKNSINKLLTFFAFIPFSFIILMFCGISLTIFE